MHLDLSYQTQLYLGLFEREIAPWLRKFSNGINTAIDIGAGEGEHTLYFLTKTPAKKVFAFEPLEDSRARLMTNLKLSGFVQSPRLEVSEKFVGSSDNDQACTLDSLAPHIFLPCLIKMDVDGPEVSILKGAAQLLRMRSIYWIIETHSPELEQQCIEILRGARFTTIIVQNAWWRLFIPEQRPIPHNRWLVAMPSV